MAASWTAAIRGGETVMISAAGDEAGCSWTSSGGELHNGEPDGIEPRRRYSDGRRRGRLLTARSDNLLHGDHEMPTMMCRTPSCMRAERKHARTRIKQIR
jgi:hypothetical protein